MKPNAHTLLFKVFSLNNVAKHGEGNKEIEKSCTCKLELNFL